MVMGKGVAFDVDGLYIDTFEIFGEVLRIYDLETGNLCVEVMATPRSVKLPRHATEYGISPGAIPKHYLGNGSEWT